MLKLVERIVANYVRLHEMAKREIKGSAITIINAFSRREKSWPAFLPTRQQIFTTFYVRLSNTDLQTRVPITRGVFLEDRNKFCFQAMLGGVMPFGLRAAMVATVLMGVAFAQETMSKKVQQDPSSSQSVQDTTPPFAPAVPVVAQNNDIDAPQAQPGQIVGTVTDMNNETVSGATVVLQGPAPSDRRTVVTNEDGFFELHNVKPGIAYHVTVSGSGFADWTSSVVTLDPGQYKILTDIKLRIEVRTTVTVGSSFEEVATEQVKVEETQRVFGLIPNFYVVYDPDAVPLTAKLKFKLALKVATDPITAVGIAMLSGIQQAGDSPNYAQGAKGYGERFGANAADGFSDIMIGGAILPSLLHQDPRYFYQGTGTNMSRVRHALLSPFICKGDNGKWQPNYSTLGGDLASSAISNAYYPQSNRGMGLVFGNFALSTAERMVSGMAQEFVLRKVTHKAQ